MPPHPPAQGHTPTLQSLNRALLRTVCGSKASAEIVADRLEELEAANASLSARVAKLEEENVQLRAALERSLIVVSREVRKGMCPSGLENGIRSLLTPSRADQEEKT